MGAFGKIDELGQSPTIASWEKMYAINHMWIKLQYGSNNFLFVTGVYLQTENKENTIRDEILANIAETYDSLEDKGKVVVLGDFNARIGRKGKLSNNVVLNENGVNMLKWISEHNLQVFNSTDDNKHHTRERKDIYSVIDYILGRDTLKRKFSKVKVVDDYCGSDHRLLMDELNLNVDIKKVSKRTILK
eukprot:Awhi_evm2s11665